MVPPAENGAFFVTTNVVITPNQTWGECPEVNFHRHVENRQVENLRIHFRAGFGSFFIVIITNPCRATFVWEESC